MRERNGCVRFSGQGTSISLRKAERSKSNMSHFLNLINVNMIIFIAIPKGITNFI